MANQNPTAMDINPDYDTAYAILITGFERTSPVTIRFLYGWPISRHITGVPDLTDSTIEGTSTIGKVLEIVNNDFAAEVLRRTFGCRIPEDIKELRVCSQADEDSTKVYSGRDIHENKDAEIWKDLTHAGYPVRADKRPMIYVVIKEPKIKKALRQATSVGNEDVVWNDAA